MKSVIRSLSIAAAAVLVVAAVLPGQPDKFMMAFDPSPGRPDRYQMVAGAQGSAWSAGEFSSISGNTVAFVSETFEDTDDHVARSTMRFDSYVFNTDSSEASGVGRAGSGGDEAGDGGDDGGGGDGIAPGPAGDARDVADRLEREFAGEAPAGAGIGPGGGGGGGGASEPLPEQEQDFTPLLEAEHTVLRNRRGEVLTSSGVPLELVRDERERGNLSLGQMMEYFQMLRFPDREVYLGETWTHDVYVTIPGLRTLQKVIMEYRLPIRDSQVVQQSFGGARFLTLPTFKAYRFQPSMIIDLFGFAPVRGNESNTETDVQIDRAFQGTLQLQGRAYMNPHTDRLLDLLVQAQAELRVHEDRIPIGDTAIFRQTEEKLEYVQHGFFIFACHEQAISGVGIGGFPCPKFSNTSGF